MSFAESSPEGRGDAMLTRCARSAGGVTRRAVGGCHSPSIDVTRRERCHARWIVGQVVASSCSLRAWLGFSIRVSCTYSRSRLSGVIERPDRDPCVGSGCAVDRPASWPPQAAAAWSYRATTARGGIPTKLPRDRRGRAADQEPDLLHPATAGAQQRDLLALRERQVTPRQRCLGDRRHPASLAEPPDANRRSLSSSVRRFVVVFSERPPSCQAC